MMPLCRRRRKKEEEEEEEDMGSYPGEAGTESGLINTQSLEAIDSADEELDEP